ncbi:hypothetical protein V6N13_050490 [Hibiscus sabdariffa]|uniref:Agglutinin domain-containing protein n=1 Tax=Hibiscus sabdariffa TaxID=183260 RepID=A0ABR2PHW4_9ROSI
MELSPKIALQPFIAFQPNDNLNYLSYIRGGGGAADGYLRFSEARVDSPHAKFEVEFSNNDLVHIRSCQNNKYWERTQNISITGDISTQYWITATAEKKEEDQTKESCTLFKVSILTNMDEKKTVRIMHVQSGCYLRLWKLSSTTYNRCVLANHKVSDGLKTDVFTTIDWMSVLVLPRYVAFKGDIGKYLALRSNESYPYLQFATEDIGDPTVACEVFANNDGPVRIKQISNQNYWRRSPDWIWADSKDTTSNNKDTLFRPIKVNDQTIGLINLGNGNYCKRLTADGKTDCLNAAISSATKDTQLTVAEAVLTREIYGVRYDLDNARVYNEQILSLDKKTSRNPASEASTLEVLISYTETRTRSWNNMFSLKSGVKSTMEFKLPLIFEGKIELSSELQTGVEWGKENTFKTHIEAVHKITVRPMTEATVSVFATKGECDVPFTYLQRDTLFDGSTVISEVQGGTFTGSNYYNINFVTTEKKIED